MGQRLAGPVCVIERERERVSDVWQSRRGPPGALIHLCLAETTGALMQQRWRGRRGRRGRWLGAKRRGVNGERGAQMKERQLMWKERIKMMPGKVKSEAKNLE